MAVKRITIHRIEIEDIPGSLQKLFSKAASEGVDMLCFTAISTGAGKGHVYISAKDPAGLELCAKKAQIQAKPAIGFIIQGKDHVGAAADALKALGDANINGIAAAAMVCDGKYQMLVVVQSADADKAEKVL